MSLGQNRPQKKQRQNDKRKEKVFPTGKQSAEDFFALESFDDKSHRDEHWNCTLRIQGLSKESNSVKLLDFFSRYGKVFSVTFFESNEFHPSCKNTSNCPKNTRPEKNDIFVTFQTNTIAVTARKTMIKNKKDFALLLPLKSPDETTEKDEACVMIYWSSLPKKPITLMADTKTSSTSTPTHEKSLDEAADPLLAREENNTKKTRAPGSKKYKKRPKNNSSYQNDPSSAFFMSPLREFSYGPQAIGTPFYYPSSFPLTPDPQRNEFSLPVSHMLPSGIISPNTNPYYWNNYFAPSNDSTYYNTTTPFFLAEESGKHEEKEEEDVSIFLENTLKQVEALKCQVTHLQKQLKDLQTTSPRKKETSTYFSLSASAPAFECFTGSKTEKDVCDETGSTVNEKRRFFLELPTTNDTEYLPEDTIIEINDNPCTENNRYNT